MKNSAFSERYKIDVSSILQNSVSAILDWMYPPVCVSCYRPSLKRVPVCIHCLTKLEKPDPQHMWREIESLPALLPPQPLFALWQFDDGGLVQLLQHTLKYGNAPRLGMILGEFMGSDYIKRVDFFPDLVVPVPLARKRFLERGYNQSELLARGLSKTLNVPCDSSMLIRTRNTHSQTTLDRLERWHNVSDAFSLSPAANVSQKVGILLVDDVFTTGATLVAAAQPFLKEGADVGLATLAFAR